MKNKTTKPKHGDLKVWWIPQIPGKPFEVPVENLVEAKLLLDTLADYDQFQLDNNIKPDYANTGGLSFFDANDDSDCADGSWCEWGDEDGREITDVGNDVDLDGLRVLSRLDLLPKCCYQ